MADKAKTRKWDPPEVEQDRRKSDKVKTARQSDNNADKNDDKRSAVSQKGRTAKSAKSLGQSDKTKPKPGNGAAASNTRTRSSSGSQRAAPRDDRYTLTIVVDGDDNEQFNLLCDGRAYWGGYEPPYKFEIKLAGGEHELRVMQRHALDKQPSRFVPLPLAIMLGDGLKCEFGPYYAALDARVGISSDSKLTVRYTLEGRVGRSSGCAAFDCSPGKELDFEVLDTSMSTTPRLRRRWATVNYIVLIAFVLAALTVVGLGAYMAVRPNGSLGGGVLIGCIGLAMALCCAGIAGNIREALDGEYAPDMDFPASKAKKRRSPGKDAQESSETASVKDKTDQIDEAEQDTDKKTTCKRSKSRSKKTAQTENDYDGAYDDAGEMGEFEEAGLSTADLSPEQLKTAKKQLMRKLGGNDGD